MSHKERPSTQRPSTQHPGTQPPALPCTGVESHAHLDSRRFAGDLNQVLSRAKKAGVAQIGQVFLSPNSWRMGKDAYPSRPEHPEVFFLLGIHPSEAHEFSPGIPDEIKPRVFEMFFSGANKVADSRRSLGLGLSLCRAIVNAHGGEISVADNAPKGAVFTFTLPAGEVELHE